MAGQSEDFKKALARESEIDLSVTGRKSGRTITNPVWFVWEGETLYLLPYQGTATQWYKNALAQPKIALLAGGVAAQCTLLPIHDAEQVAAVVEKFRAKYGSGNVKQYYSNLDAAAIARV